MTMRIATALLSVIATLLAITPALAGAKDESAAEWLFPKAFNDWRNGLADRGLALGGTYVGDNIANVTGGISKGAIHFGRLDLTVDADLEKLFGWSGGGVAGLVGIEGGVVSGVFNLESSGVEASDWRPRHDERYHEA
jgi:porin